MGTRQRSRATKESKVCTGHGDMEDRSARFRIGQLALRTGVSPERLRKWETRYALFEPQRSRGGYRLYSLEDERRVRLMQRHLSRGYAAAEAAELARQGIVSPSPARLTPRLAPGVVERSARLLRRAWHEYDEGAAQRALDDLFRAFTIDAVLRDAILPLLRELGHAWEAGTATAGQEHFASTIVEARLMALARGWGSGNGPRALLACPPGERHTLGLLAFGIALSRRGWRITYLGAETPLDSLAHAAERIQPSLVMLASVQPRRFTTPSTHLRRLTGKHRVAIAGAGASAAVAKRLGAERIAADPVTAAATLAGQSADRPA
jgi:MerR family transcriptional regulator, light-induced transcriptional regulator